MQVTLNVMHNGWLLKVYTKICSIDIRQQARLKCRFWPFDLFSFFVFHGIEFNLLFDVGSYHTQSDTQTFTCIKSVANTKQQQQNERIQGKKTFD